MKQNQSPFSVTSLASRNTTCVIALQGYLDAHTAPDLEDTIGASILGGCYRIVIDFSQLEYISSAGLGVFMVFIEQVRANGGDIKLAAMRGNVRNVFDLLGFPVLFSIYDTVDSAIDAFPMVDPE